MNGTNYNLPCVPKTCWITSITRHDRKYLSEMPHNKKPPPQRCGLHLTLKNPTLPKPSCCQSNRRAACSVGRRRVHNVPDVVSCPAYFERLKVMSSPDVADIAIGSKVHENGQRRVTTPDGNRDFDLRQASPVRASERGPSWASWTGRWRSSRARRVVSGVPRRSDSPGWGRRSRSPT